MKAVFQRKFGGPEVLEVGELPDPVPGDDELLVRVRATSMNPLDGKIRDGSLKFLAGSKMPKVLGCDVAGEVISAGAKATRFKPGDAVVGMINIMAGKPGANAEKAVVRESWAVAKPAGVSFEDAAATPVAAITAHEALNALGHIGKGQRVLINGASGGVGTFAVQLAKSLGAEVTAVCSARNAELVRSLGADRVIDYAKEDFRKGTERYDLVFDVVNNASFGSARGVLTTNGAWVATLPSPSAFLARVVTRFTRKKAGFTSAMGRMQDLPELLNQVADKSLRPVIEKVYPLEQLAEAHRASDSGRVRGKLVIKV